jgi:hypothetical protein
MYNKTYITGAIIALFTLSLGGWIYFRPNENKSEQMLLEEYTRASRDCFLAIRFEEECPEIRQIRLILMSRGIEPRIVKLSPHERVR